MKIKAHWDENEEIPTLLSLSVDDEYSVIYQRDEDEFSYTFYIYGDRDMKVETANEIIEEIVEKLLAQSAGLERSWEMVSKAMIVDTVPPSARFKYKVYFKLKD